MNSEKLRFNNILGDEYEMFRNVVYYYDNLEREVSHQLDKLVENKNGLFLDLGIGSGITSYHVLSVITTYFNIGYTFLCVR